jgi:hypothetical protein
MVMLSLQISRDFGKLGEGGLEVFDISAAMMSGSGRLALSSTIMRIPFLNLIGRFNLGIQR